MKCDQDVLVMTQLVTMDAFVLLVFFGRARCFKFNDVAWEASAVTRVV